MGFAALNASYSLQVLIPQDGLSPQARSRAPSTRDGGLFGGLFGGGLFGN
jgi:hypothetical protein